MIYKLKHGQALVIAGQKGCGKSTMARRLARRHGSFVEVEVCQMETQIGRNNMLVAEPNTVICDGIPTDNESLANIKALITGETVTVARKYDTPKTVKAPNFIFCISDADCSSLVLAGICFCVTPIGKLS